jgi:isopentenyl diphosphate isomerase/L-lactate dehydrogenase-like FMN-dependent dehydrogenase
MLPECVDAVRSVGDSSIEVYVDGGIRKVKIKKKFFFFL